MNRLTLSVNSNSYVKQVRPMTCHSSQPLSALLPPAIAQPLLDRFPQVDVAPVDLADLDSVRAFYTAWDGPVDAVVANAGVMALPERQVNTQGWEMHLAINFLGLFALVHGLRPTPRRRSDRVWSWSAPARDC